MALILLSSASAIIHNDTEFCEIALGINTSSTENYFLCTDIIVYLTLRFPIINATETYMFNNTIYLLENTTIIHNNTIYHNVTNSSYNDTYLRSEIDDKIRALNNTIIISNYSENLEYLKEKYKYELDMERLKAEYREPDLEEIKKELKKEIKSDLDEELEQDLNDLMEEIKSPAIPEDLVKKSDLEDYITGDSAYDLIQKEIYRSEVAPRTQQLSPNVLSRLPVTFYLGLILLLAIAILLYFQFRKPKIQQTQTSSKILDQMSQLSEALESRQEKPTPPKQEEQAQISLEEEEEKAPKNYETIEKLRDMQK